MKRFSGRLLYCMLLGGLSSMTLAGCGGSGTPAPMPTPTPSQVFPNDQSLAQTAPIKLGTSGGNSTDLGGGVCCIGTLGSLWTLTGSPNKTVILSNNHVLDRSDKGTPGQPIDQPLQLVCTALGAPAPISVATLTQGIPIKPGANEPGNCPGSKAPLCGHAPMNVDAAIAEISVGQVDLTGTILDLGPAGASSIAPLPPSNTIGNPTLGEGVGKSGRTTGLTCSTIQSLNSSIQVDYDATCGDTTPAFTAIFDHQIMIAGGSFSAGGDSGSLVVDTVTARAVGLLYGGNTTSTVANPIQDVITAFGGNAAFTIVGGSDHAVSCARQATASATHLATTQSAAVPQTQLNPQEQERVTIVQRRRAAQLMQNPGIRSVTIGESADNPSEGALIIHASGTTALNIPPTVDGVRTRIVINSESSTAQIALAAGMVERATAVKEAHLSEFMGKPGIQGIGVSLSVDNPSETAISIYLIKGMAHPPIPPLIDGVRTRVFEGTRFKAF